MSQYVTVVSRELVFSVIGISANINTGGALVSDIPNSQNMCTMTQSLCLLTPQRRLPGLQFSLVMRPVNLSMSHMSRLRKHAFIGPRS